MDAVMTVVCIVSFLVVHASPSRLGQRVRFVDDGHPQRIALSPCLWQLQVTLFGLIHWFLFRR